MKIRLESHKDKVKSIIILLPQILMTRESCKSRILAAYVICTWPSCCFTSRRQVSRSTTTTCLYCKAVAISFAVSNSGERISLTAPLNEKHNRKWILYHTKPMHMFWKGGVRRGWAKTMVNRFPDLKEARIKWGRQILKKQCVMNVKMRVMRSARNTCN